MTGGWLNTREDEQRRRSEEGDGDVALHSVPGALRIEALQFDANHLTRVSEGCWAQLRRSFSQRCMLPRQHTHTYLTEVTHTHYPDHHVRQYYALSRH